MIKERLNLSDEDVKMCKQIGFRTLSLCSIMEMEKMQALAYVRVMIPVINRYYHTQEERIEGPRRQRCRRGRCPQPWRSALYQ